ncbi:hypothetical protein HPB47_003577, partial [Ixodes persulcatus]
LAQPYTFALAALNVRSINKHFVDVLHDPVLSNMPLLWLSETWTDVPVQMNGYMGLACNKRVDSRAGGVAIYAKTDSIIDAASFDMPAIVSDFADVCAVRLHDGTVVATVHIHPATPKREIESFVTDVLGWTAFDNDTPIVVMGDFNIEIGTPDG